MTFTISESVVLLRSYFFTPWPYLSIIFVSIVSILVYDLSRVLLMPPGPIPIPFFGNASILPKSSAWITFQQWSQKYGPMFTIWQGRRPTIVISDPQITYDLLEKRSNIFSSRPRTVAMGELLWEMGSVLVQPYGKEWSIRRKLLHAALTPKALRLYKPTQEAEATRLCVQFLRLSEDSTSPSVWDWDRLFERFTASIVFCVAYGHRIDSLNAKVIRQRFEFMHFSASLNVPGAYLVESFPILKYVPEFLAPWKARIKRMGRQEAEANMALVDVVREDLKSAVEEKHGKAEVPDSLTKLLLEMRQNEHIPLSERNFAFVPASLFGAGSDTTASTLCSAILAAVTHPSAFQQARKELDMVVGTQRTPVFADESRLPYLRALVKEVLRWRPVAVLGGTPHANTESDWYQGKWIPKGTTILGNNWAINLNEKYYPNPHLFEPNRFLQLETEQSTSEVLPELFSISQEKLNGEPTSRLLGQAHPSTKGHSSFGWGRRICPGADLASNTLFIALAKLIWAFDILPAEGKTSKDYNTFAYTQGFNIRPQRFECKIKVRDEGRKLVLQTEMGGATTWLEKFSAFGE